MLKSQVKEPLFAIFLKLTRVVVSPIEFVVNVLHLLRKTDVKE
jgi:hypothetical protein